MIILKIKNKVLYSDDNNHKNNVMNIYNIILFRVVSYANNP